MTTNPQTQKKFFSKVSHFSHFPKIPTYNPKPIFPISNELPRAALSPLLSLPSPLKMHRGVSPNCALCIMNYELFLLSLQIIRSIL